MPAMQGKDPAAITPGNGVESVSAVLPQRQDGRESIHSRLMGTCNEIDGSCAPGIFPLVSVPTIAGCVGALIILVAAVATPIARSQQTRQIWFYLMSGGAVLKIVTMEIARIITH